MLPEYPEDYEKESKMSSGDKAIVIGAVVLSLAFWTCLSGLVVKATSGGFADRNPDNPAPAAVAPPVQIQPPSPESIDDAGSRYDYESNTIIIELGEELQGQTR